MAAGGAMLRALGFAALLLPALHRGEQGSAERRCFCKVTGHLDDCTCDVETIDAFNNYKLFPRLNRLLESDYFRYYKVNLKKPCPFWNDNSHCGIRDCAVKPCPSDEVPDGIRSAGYKYSEEANSRAEECEEANRLGAVDESLSKETQQAMLQWTWHDDSSDSFCEADDIHSPDAEYVDLLLNPERYTGYRGPDAWKIWNSIYEENCFKPQNVKRPLASGGGDDGGECSCFYPCHKQVFVLKTQVLGGFRIHGVAVVSVKHCLVSLYTYVLFLSNKNTPSSHLAVKKSNLWPLFPCKSQHHAVLLPPASSCPEQNEHGWIWMNTWKKSWLVHNRDQFSSLFPQEEVRLHFKNISKIMDCVGCFKCRLWGKLQTQGLGTAMKILFSENLIEKIPESGPSYGFQLTRQEIVALFNAFGRISTSVRELQNFRDILRSVR
ncbi:ERO1-like protein alpha [Coturnix japonica]|uniref:ERO1-like protein alpha n=1 Tax=Coturnix japonica TaxID=93934 RepID=UPI0013A5EF2E|nr:ERO1-like protein alpha [Coturnix japonica]